MEQKQHSLLNKLRRTISVLDGLIESLPPTDLILAVKDTTEALKSLMNKTEGPETQEIISLWEEERSCTDFKVLGYDTKDAEILLGANYLYYMTKDHFQDNDIGRRFIFLSATIFMYLKHFYKVRKYHSPLLEHADSITEQLMHQSAQVFEMLKYSNTI